MRGVLIALVILAALIGLWLGRGQPELVVYCAHDAVYADAILQDFALRRGLRIAVKYDSEATKSLGLTELIIREAGRPRADVFWNNQLGGTHELAERGLLEPHRGVGWARIPEAFRDPEGRYAGFAARLRVYILHGEKPPVDGAQMERIWAGDLERVTWARPLFGTTLEHYSVLAHAWGIERLKAWHQDALGRGLRIADSNGAVADAVGSGYCDMGWTDTDDYFLARDAGKSVGMLPVGTLPTGKPIIIPNTVAMLKGARHPVAARELIDHLLSAEVELRLARSPTRQIPLGPVDEAELPAEVRELRLLLPQAYPLIETAAARREVLAWLREVYAP